MELDPTIHFTDLTIDDVTYKLAYSFNSICVVEKLTGLNLLGATGMSDLTAAQLRAVLFAAMIPAETKITLSEVGELIGFDTLPAIMEALSAAWTASLSARKKRKPALAE